MRYTPSANYRLVATARFSFLFFCLAILCILALCTKIIIEKKKKTKAVARPVTKCMVEVGKKKLHGVCINCVCVSISVFMFVL